MWLEMHWEPLASLVKKGRASTSFSSMQINRVIPDIWIMRIQLARPGAIIAADNILIEGKGF